MESALTQRDPKQMTSALRRCVLNAERCVQRMRLSDVVLSVSASHHSPNTTSDGPSDPQAAWKPATGNEIAPVFVVFSILLSLLLSSFKV